MENLTKCYCGHTTTCDCGPEEPKQEDMITKIMQMDAKMAYDSLPKQSTKDRILSETSEEIKQRVRDTANRLVMKQETLEEATERYANESFIPMRNLEGEPLRIPIGQSVPCGFTKHKKIATKHFTAGYKLAQENINALDFEIDSLKREIKVLKHQQEKSYSEEDMKSFGKFMLLGNHEYKSYTDIFNEWFEQFKKK